MKERVLFLFVAIFLIMASIIEILAIIHGEDGKSLALTMSLLSGAIGYVLKWLKELDRRKWENNNKLFKKDHK